MTAREWLNLHFLVTGDDFSPINNYVASVAFFASVFGTPLEQALAGGTSTHAALMAVVGGTGWDLYFNDWKTRGILA